MNRRLRKSLGANSIGQLINVAIQFASLPIFVKFWGVEQYGLWLIISALPAYLSMADAGLLTAAGNRMVMSNGANDESSTTRLIGACIALLIALTIAGTIVAAIVSIAYWWQQPTVSGSNSIALFILTTSVFVSFWTGLSLQIGRAYEKNAEFELWNNGIRVVEWAAQIASLVFGGGYVEVALAGLVARILVTVLTLRIALRLPSQRIPRVQLSVALQNFKGLYVAGIGFMASPMINALSFQGQTLVIGYLFGPVAVTAFNAYRTIARVPVQLSSIVSFSIWPEVSRTFAAGSLKSVESVKSIVMRYAYINGALSLLAFAVVTMVAEIFLNFWTAGVVTFIFGNFILVAMGGLAAAFLQLPRAVLFALNRPTQLTLISVVVCTAALIIGTLFGHWLGLGGALLVFAVAEVFILSAAVTLIVRFWKI